MYRDSLDADDQEFFDELIASDRPGSQIAKIIDSAGGNIKAHTLTRHLRGDCGCR